MQNTVAPDPGKPPTRAGSKRGFEPDSNFLRRTPAEDSFDSDMNPPTAGSNAPVAVTIPNESQVKQAEQFNICVPATQAAKTSDARSTTQLNDFLKHSFDPDATRLAGVVGWCDKISGTLEGLLSSFANEHPKEGNYLRSWLSLGVGNVIQGKLEPPSRTKDTEMNHLEPVPGATANTKRPTKPTYAAALAAGNEPDSKRRVIHATPPRNQGDNDRRVMLRLAEEHPIRKMEAFCIREKVRATVRDPALVLDVWHVNSGITILTPSPAKAAQLLQDSARIKADLGADKVEQQENWTTFVLGPIIKRQQGLTGIVDVTEDMVMTELCAATQDKIPIQGVFWTQRTASPHLLEGFARVCVKTQQASQFPSRLRLFGRPVTINRIKAKPTIHHCTRCHGFHHERNCPRFCKCPKCGESEHAGQPCSRPERCLNCRGPYPSDHARCPARPKIINGRVTSPGKKALRAIRVQGGRDYAAAHPKDQGDNDASPSSPTPSPAHTQAEAPMSDSQDSSNAYAPLATASPAGATDHTPINMW